MNWVKSHKLLTAGIVAGVVVLYYLYKNMQANAAAAAANSTAAFPAYPTVIGVGGGGGSVASVPGGSQGTSAPAPVASPAAIATIPGGNPPVMVSGPAADNVASAVVNAPAPAPAFLGGPTQAPPSGDVAPGVGRTRTMAQFLTATFGAGKGTEASLQNTPIQDLSFPWTNPNAAANANLPAYSGSEIRNSSGALVGWTGWTPQQNQSLYGSTFGGGSSTSPSSPMIPMASGPVPVSIPRTSPLGPVQMIPGGSLA